MFTYEKIVFISSPIPTFSTNQRVRKLMCSIPDAMNRTPESPGDILISGPMSTMWLRVPGSEGDHVTGYKAIVC